VASADALDVRCARPAPTIAVVVAIALTGCASAHAETGSAAPRAAASPVSPPAAVSPTPRPAATPPSTDVADRALLTRARDTGRSAVAMCLYVDPRTGRDPGRALDMLQESIDALVNDGYAALAGQPASPCPQAPLFIRTSTVHAKNSGNGPIAAVPRVLRPSEWLLWVAVVTPASITAIFGASSLERGAEEIACTGDSCGEVTGSIYLDSATFADTFARRRLILVGLGIGPQR
jgi:hypothetical protein